MKDVYTIYSEKGPEKNGSHWVRIGVAFDNKDGSINVILDALPLSGRLHIRNREPERAAESKGG